jgi:hypothetical protein
MFESLGDMAGHIYVVLSLLVLLSKKLVMHSGLRARAGLTFQTHIPWGEPCVVVFPGSSQQFIL